MIKVVVAGAAGRMGSESVKSVWFEEDMELVGAIDVERQNEDVGILIGGGKTGVYIESDLEKVLQQTKPDVLVDFTNMEVVLANVKTAVKYGVRPVVGTTGIAKEEIEEIEKLCREKAIGGVIAPNFALGAVFMMKFAEMAARYFPNVEIIELHHDRKLDAPSGTAIQTAEIISRASGEYQQDAVVEHEKLSGSRGGQFNGGIRIHSVRLPGLVAHQEVLFGGEGQTLSIRHDSLSRKSFMPGLLMAIRKVMRLEGVVYGLDKLIFE